MQGSCCVCNQALQWATWKDQRVGQGKFKPLIHTRLVKRPLYSLNELEAEPLFKLRPAFWGDKTNYWRNLPGTLVLDANSKYQDNTVVRKELFVKRTEVCDYWTMNNGHYIGTIFSILKSVSISHVACKKPKLVVITMFFLMHILYLVSKFICILKHPCFQVGILSTVLYNYLHTRWIWKLWYIPLSLKLNIYIHSLWNRLIF